MNVTIFKKSRFSESKLRGYCHVKMKSFSRDSKHFQKMMDALSDEDEPSRIDVFIKLALILGLSAFGAVILDYLLS